MLSQNNCRVFGLQDNGELIAITIKISRDEAEKIVKLIEPNSAFMSLMIECDDDDGVT